MNNDSPRKDRTPFRPLNSLHSTKQPDFKPSPSKKRLSASENLRLSQSSADNSRLSQSNIGEDSSLFDSTDGSINFDIIPIIPKQYSPRRQQTHLPTAQSHKMVNQRDPPRPTGSNPSPEKKPAQSASNVPPNTAASRSSVQQPEFGKASPMRNPLRQPYSNVFNTNKDRNEHHRPKPAPAFRDPRSIISAAPASAAAPLQLQKPSHTEDALFAPINNPLYSQRQPPKQQVNPLHSATHTQPIRMPANQPPKTILPTPRPQFSSSIGPNTSFQPFRPPPPPKKTIDLTNQDSDDDDHFDPDAALREDKFGGPDPYAYVDATQTGENIKALLEGAFEDDQDKPKIKLRKRAKKQSPQQDKKVMGLEARLKQLDLKPAQPEEKPEEEDDDDEEDGTVEGMKVKLLPHQVDGVAWMTDKEIGVRKKNGVLPKGGILADDMGLGKTIQSVTLILTNPRPALDAKPPPENPKQKMPIPDVSKGTLVVAPLALIKQWEAEIKDKVEKDHALRVLVHHGPSRTKSHNELKKYDVVITTYQILASEHAGSSDAPGGAKMGCFGVHWYRVILDEAHSIKNRNAKSTQACCALRSWYRWCLTGTPMQNNLDELQSLINFLRIKPYNDLRTWKDQITTPMKAGKGQFAIKRIQYFLKGFMKRRTKDILKQEGALNFGGKSKDGESKSQGMQIVKREVEVITCELDPRERDFYNQLQDKAQSRLNDMMGGEKTDYIGALVLLLRLRQACNHPQLIAGAMSKDKDAMALTQPSGSQTPGRKTSVDDDLDDLAGALGGLTVETKLCDVCNVKLTPQEAIKASPRCEDCEGIALHNPITSKKTKKEKKTKVKPEAARKPAPKSRNRRIVLDSDDEDDEEGEGDWLVDPSQQTLPSLGKAGGTDDEDAEGGGETLDSIDTHDSTSASSSSEDETSDYEGGPASNPNMPFASTKIRKLLRILHAESPAHKTIVFSQFTSMLDLIEPHLKQASLKYVRYDGSMKNDAREAALESLRNNKATRVLLCSLKCGSLGLNLTAASRVVIVEPFWNPFVEEQAIDRVHRLNQTVDVKVFRLTVGDTVEERILELQEKKRELSRAAIEGGKAAAKLSMKDIMSLFGRNPDAHHGVEGEEEEKDYSMPKVARDNRQQQVQQAQQQVQQGQRRDVSGGARKEVGWSQGRLSFDQPQRDERKREKVGGRVRVEDPVYGRR